MARPTHLKLEPGERYIEFGLGRGAAASKAEARRFRSAFRKAATKMVQLNMREDAYLIRDVLSRWFRQETSPKWGIVSEEQYQALSRALRLTYYDPKSPKYKTRKACTGAGNKAYQRFMHVVRQSERIRLRMLSQERTQDINSAFMTWGR